MEINQSKLDSPIIKILFPRLNFLLQILSFNWEERMDQIAVGTPK